MPCRVLSANFSRIHQTFSRHFVTVKREGGGGVHGMDYGWIMDGWMSMEVYDQLVICQESTDM